MTVNSLAGMPSKVAVEAAGANASISSVTRRAIGPVVATAGVPAVNVTGTVLTNTRTPDGMLPICARRRVPAFASPAVVKSTTGDVSDGA